MTHSDFKRYINTLSDTLLRYLAKNLQDINDAKDILQETFIALWENKDKVEEGKVKSWLFTTAHNKMLKLIRYNKLRKSPVANTNPYGQNNKEQDYYDNQTLKHGKNNVQNYENSQQIDILLSVLSETMKQCLILKEWEGFSIKEISEILQISQENVKINLFRAKLKIKKEQLN